jgi:hypothetical protein
LISTQNPDDETTGGDFLRPKRLRDHHQRLLQAPPMSRAVPHSNTKMAMLMISPTIGSANGKPSQIPITPTTSARRYSRCARDAVGDQGRGLDPPSDSNPIHRFGIGFYLLPQSPNGQWCKVVGQSFQVQLATGNGDKDGIWGCGYSMATPAG